MKKILLIMSAFVLSIMFFSCGGSSNDSDEDSKTDKTNCTEEFKAYNMSIMINPDWKVKIEKYGVAIYFTDEEYLYLSYNDEILSNSNNKLSFNTADEYYEWKMNEETDSSATSKIIKTNNNANILSVHIPADNNYGFKSHYYYYLFNDNTVTQLSISDYDGKNKDIEYTISSIKPCEYIQPINDSIPDYMTETVYNTGRELIQLLDDVCDKKITFKDARNDVENCTSILKSYTNDEADSINITSIHSYALSIEIDYASCAYNEALGSLSNSDLSKIVEDRNNLCFYFNVEERN